MIADKAKCVIKSVPGDGLFAGLLKVSAKLALNSSNWTVAVPSTATVTAVLLSSKRLHNLQQR